MGISFDFEGAPPSRCVVEGEKEFSILISPEHAPPINPSPWYAFRYTASGKENVTVHLRYLGAKHRYSPKWQSSERFGVVDAQVRDDGKTASLTLPPGQAIVSAQELLGVREHEALLTRLDRSAAVRRLTLGRSHDGRPIEALRVGNPNAEKLVILLGRQHPPEVTGAIAMEHFLETLVLLADTKQYDAEDLQILAVPLLNPDGVARGHWRANLGGVDLNRDWGTFSQPETRSIAQWLEKLPDHVRPIAMVDFHSTSRNLFYVQGDEASEGQEQFLARWLVGKEGQIAGYHFAIERRNANPGTGTAKNWFYANYLIPSYTYEVGDETERVAIATAAKELAKSFVEAL
ncbi:M14 family metallopeptidase [Allopontixanthobacter sediminis]|uniref:Peptidase M14 domain-containing protein n=1 Tax=Allopontixanthobacter sediminis TaxID=1689985 RepID=A0A845B5B5_9SPHN|nr:hypothetical protein [Allopontixanthobacter sediminis]